MPDRDTYKFSVAPMMDGTDRHCRFFHRALSRHTRLYTEMVTAQAICFGDQDHLLGFDPSEHPVALQLGGSDPALLAQAAKVGEVFGYDEVNLNVGCPSDRVQSGTFGACLMRTPELVADCVAAMIETVDIPVTVKCRLGVDDQDPDVSLFEFVDTVKAAECAVFFVHARKAWLQGLSPKENRTIPPLDYDIVRRLKKMHPELTIILNGGIEKIDDAVRLADAFDGVMLGRAPYAQPYMLSDVDQLLFEQNAPRVSRESVVAAMSAYMKRTVNDRIRPHAIARHMLGLYHGAPGARAWRRFLSEEGPSAGPDLLDRALMHLRERLAA